MIIFFQVSNSSYPPALATKALFVQFGLWPVTKPVMVTIPAGEFQMGDLNGKGDKDEQPVHAVHITKAFELGQYEVTFDEYDLFAAATGREKPSDQGWHRGDRPIINVSWDDAVTYTQWLSGRTGLEYRLPSEAEWEYAARSTTTTERYWPENPVGEADAACTYSNVFDAKNSTANKNTYSGITWEPFTCEDQYQYTAPVGQFKANLWQLHDMLGNVWEWTQECYVDNYQASPLDGSAQESTDGKACPLRVLRGGSWYFEPMFVRSANRVRTAPGDRDNDIGFRLARTL
jgi:formylglycine-generating enzyme required for sulfatase activity